MSAPAKTSGRDIRSAARKILEEQGLDGVSMQAVADAVGVRPPSLYKHFADRADLLQAIIQDALEDLRRTVDRAVDSHGAAYQNLERMAMAYRTFAKKNSGAYRLIFADQAPANEADLQARLASAATLLKILTEAIGPEKALPGARTLVAFLHGFVLMETTGLFRFGGDINQAFRFGVKTILDALLAG
jgi:AcrR family transcriptional regulator